MHAAIIEWLDSTCEAKWHNKFQAKEDNPNLKCCTVGIIFRETVEAIHVVQSMSLLNSIDNRLTIPRAAITRIRNLKV